MTAGFGSVTSYSSVLFSSRRRHTRFDCDWSSDVCSSDLTGGRLEGGIIKGGIINGEPGYTFRAIFRTRWTQLFLRKVFPILKFSRSEEAQILRRSEERRVGKEGRSRWSPYHYKKNMTITH